ncbi:3-oxoacyl-reductase [Xylogone sp. PMI_703]|nr:3-oxoacyl-reductase [Xylogone sp. PMI_703]
MLVDNEIRGRLALITGASGGIGAACASELLTHGAHLALMYCRSKESIDALVNQLHQIGTFSDVKISVHQVDMASGEDLISLFEDIYRQHGRYPDILISNTGYGKRVPDLKDITFEEWNYTILVNLTASFVLCQLAIQHMQTSKWGRIVIISSIAGYEGGINGCHYAASKAGVKGMVRNLAQKHGNDGITINDVAPAIIGDTGMIPDAKYVEGTPGDVKNIPVGRLGTPVEVANIVIMACKTGYLTGQSILLSGGLK